MKIAVLDGGCYSIVSKNGNSIIKDSYLQMSSSYSDPSADHGTAVTEIIDNYTHDNEIYSIKIFDEDHILQAKNLAAYIKKCIDSVHPDIINLSMGTRIDKNGELKKAVGYAKQCHVLIVCAADNSGAVSYPAFYCDTISVISSRKIKRVNEFEVCNDGWVDVLGYSGHFSIELHGKSEKVIGSSFSTPVITAKVVKCVRTCLKKNDNDNIVVNTKNELKKIKQNNFKLEPAKYTNDSFGTKDNAIVLPINKEIFTVLNNADLITPSVVGVYDYHTSTLIGKTVANIGYSAYGTDQTIQDVESIRWESPKFNLVILGHVGELSLLFHIDILNKVVDKCKKYGKKLFALDLVENESVPESRLGGSLFVFHTPIVAIVGTSSKQGKVSTQLGMYRVLKGKGYDIEPMLTEPFSKVMGFNHYWHYGYHSKLYTWQAHVIGANSVMKRIDDENHDLIIAGSQSQVSAINMHNLGFIPIETQSLLIGINADGYILMVNPTDSSRLIVNTIQYIESYFKRPVIAIVDTMGNMESKRKIMAKTNTPVFTSSEILRLCDTTIDFFAE